MAGPPDPSAPRSSKSGRGASAAHRLEALLDELIASAQDDGTIDEDAEPTLQYGPGFLATLPAARPEPPPVPKPRPSGVIDTQPLIAMPSRVAVRPVEAEKRAAQRIDGLMEEAVAALLDRDYPVVLERLRAVLAIEPGHGRATANLERLQVLGFA